MRSWVLAMALLAACGGPRSPAETPHVSGPDAGPVAGKPPPDARPDELGIDWSLVPANDEQALAIWRQLRLDGDSWQVRLSDIPETATDVREKMAIALLREGNFACPSVATPTGCGHVDVEFQDIAPTDGIDSPCLRRQLAMWALDELDGETLETELAADVIGIAGLPPPEDDLNRAVLLRVTDEALHLQMLDAAERAGNETVADESLGNLSNQGLEDAATRLHVDGAVEVLDVGDALSMYEQAMLDDKLRRNTRVQVARELAGYAAPIGPTDPTYAPVVKVLEQAVADPDCTIAAAAADALSQIDGRRFPSAPPRGAKADAYVRTMCVTVLAGVDPEPMWKAIVGPKGVVLRSHFEDAGRIARLWADNPEAEDANHDGAPDVEDADPDGDGNAATWSEVEHIPRDQMYRISDDADVKKALTACKGTACTVPDENVTFRFTFKKGSGGHLLLDTIERDETATACDIIEP